MKLMTIKLTEVHVDLKLQARTAVDDNTIEDYREYYACGEKMPPVTVFYHKGIFHLTDGFHRVEAARQAGCEYIQARVFEGGVEEALWFSIGANKTHGLRRSNEDKRKKCDDGIKTPERKAT